MNFEIEIKLRLQPDLSKIRRTLRKLGFRAARLEDGYPEWKAAGLPVEQSTTP